MKRLPRVPREEAATSETVLIEFVQALAQQAAAIDRLAAAVERIERKIDLFAAGAIPRSALQQLLGSE